MRFGSNGIVATITLSAMSAVPLWLFTVVYTCMAFHSRENFNENTQLSDRKFLIVTICFAIVYLAIVL